VWKQVYVDPRCYFLCAVCLMLLPVKWFAGALLAAAIHELFHLAAIKILGGTIYQIKIGITGAVISMGTMSNAREMLCAAAGPAGSYLLLFLSNMYPELAICGLIQGTFNMLPIYPSDGGRILKCVLSYFNSSKAEAISVQIGAVLSLLLAMISIFWRIVPAFLIFSGLAGAAARKIPCKEGNLAVQ